MRADFPGLDCAECAALEEEGEPEADCAACPMPVMERKNEDALAIHKTISRPFARRFGLATEILGTLAGPMTKDDARVLIAKLTMIDAFEGGREDDKWQELNSALQSMTRARQ